MQHTTFPDYDDHLMQAIENRQESVISEHCQGLYELDSWADGIFCLACCERVIPNYIAFANFTNSAGGKVLRELLDDAWRSRSIGERQRATKKDLDALSFVLDDYQAELAVYAADAICVFDLAFDDSLTIPGRHACDAAMDVLNDTSKYLMNSFCQAGLLLQEVEPMLFSHPLWTLELEIQQKIADLLSDKGRPMLERIAAAQVVSRNGGTSNIGMRIT